MSLLDNLYELPRLDGRYTTILPRGVFWEKYITLKHQTTLNQHSQYNFEHVADHLTSPAMNFRPAILKKKYCYLPEFTAESSLIFTINPSNFTLF